jgi:hypothetical protein
MRATIVHVALDPMRRAGYEYGAIDADRTLNIAAPDALMTLFGRMIERGR